MSHTRPIQEFPPIQEPQPWRRQLDKRRASLQVAFRNVLFPTDFSAAADRALPYAVEIARRSFATIHAMHVISPDAFAAVAVANTPEIEVEQEEFRARKKAQLELELQELPHEFLFANGEVWENVEKLIRQKDVDLVVLGTHGRTGISKAVMGSVAETIFRQASCPVLVVGPGVQHTASHAAAAELSSILYATDFSPESLAAARYAISLAKDHRAELVLLHTSEEGVDEQESLALDTLKHVVPLGAGLPAQPTYMIQRGAPADAILGAAKKAHADLIVLGARGADKHLTTATHVSGSIASRVIANADCPVLTVHS